MSAITASDLDRLLVQPPYRFDMGLRRGDGGFFLNPPGSGPALAERREWLARTPDRYAGILPEGEGLLVEAAEIFRSLHPAAVLEEGPPSARLAALACAWEPDFLLLRPEGPDFRLLGGCVCFPSSWALEEKLGHPLRLVHGPVPGLNESLGTKIQTFLAAMRPGVDWERINWGLAASPELNLHPGLGRPRLAAGATAAETWLRVEHQALRVLPVSTGVLFGIRIRVHRLAEVAALPGVATRLAALLESMEPAVAEYKGLAACRSSLIRELRSTAFTS